jgi:hypothetical protein
LVYGDAPVNADRVAAVRQLIAEFDALDYCKQRAVNVHELVEQLREAVS